MRWVFFLGWLCLFPFIVTASAYEGAKVWWLWAGGFVLITGWLISLVRGRNVPISSNGGRFLVWIGVLFLASILGIHPLESIVGGSYRHQGVLFFFLLFLIGETIRMMPKKFDHWLGRMIGLSVIVEAALVGIERFQFPLLRPLGTVGEPNVVAGFLAVGLVWVWQLTINKIIRFVFLSVVGIGIFLTGSRAGMIAGVVVLVGLFVQSVPRLLKKFYMFLLIVSILIMGSIFVITTRSVRSNSPYEDRLLFWRLGFEQVMQRPLLGFGAESGEVLYDRAFLHENVRLINFMVDRSHNIFLDVAMWSGLIGLIVFFWWIGNILTDRWKRKDYASLLTLAAWLVFASLQPLGVTHWLLFILLASQGDALRS